MIKQRFISTIAAITLSLSVAAPAMAVTEHVDGGVWNHGTNKVDVWSYYKHAHKSHKSSASGKRLYQSGCQVAKVEAIASGPKKWTNNQAYYGFC
ncbi:bacteriocin, lactococcin 972 family [Dermatophilus congolensis]|uniref:Bacteriocin, lactococcin 972 family n=1 Tax=Dermatophilus congolensis TaxID=1863 RepID=A0AA46BL55_9MICO|nr:lactococcin 972 family bacteriocin [Dermatophilus congolensis]STD03216.1 bacteriocin, lactococcin 972 family [Dermatophilus congolensis]